MLLEQCRQCPLDADYQYQGQNVIRKRRYANGHVGQRGNE